MSRAATAKSAKQAAKKPAQTPVKTRTRGRAPAAGGAGGGKGRAAGGEGRVRRAKRLWTPAEIIARLDAEAPIPAWRAHGDPVAELVLTLLSQHTSDTNSGRAYQALVERFPNWDAVVEAPVSEIEESIRMGGLAKTKAPRLQALLTELRERLGGEWNASPLEDLPLAKAKGWLTSLPGVGPKTAACVLLFALKRPALPVDTHVHRVSQRLGLIEEKTNAKAAHALLESQLNPGQMYPFHVALIRHGRRVCKAGRPLCQQCVLSDRCPSAYLGGAG